MSDNSREHVTLTVYLNTRPEEAFFDLLVYRAFIADLSDDFVRVGEKARTLEGKTQAEFVASFLQHVAGVMTKIGQAHQMTEIAVQALRASGDEAQAQRACAACNSTVLDLMLNTLPKGARQQLRQNAEEGAAHLREILCDELVSAQAAAKEAMDAMTKGGEA